MDVTVLVNIIYNKISEEGVYCDFPQDELKLKLSNYIRKEFKKEISISALKLEKEEKSGKFTTLSKYEEEYEKIEKIMAFKAKVLSACSREDLENLIYPS